MPVRTSDHLTSRGGAAVSAATVADFRATIDGETLDPTSPAYDDARAIWNGMIDRSPGLVVRCAGPDDVERCVRFAAAHDLVVAVRGGGHSFPGHSVCDGGLMVDLSGLKTIAVDVARRTATAEPGVVWAELDAATQEHGLAVPGGQISHTGIAGLTLGGGIGWLSRKHGLTSDNLVSVDLVTADGSRVTASESGNAELFWGLRGGGGNFGIATSFTYRLHPLGTVYGGLVLHPLPAAPQVMRAAREVAAASPDELMVMPAFLHSPDGHPCCGMALCHSGDPADAEAAVAPYLEIGEPVMTQVGPMPYPAVQSMIDDAAMPGRRYYMRSYTLTELSDEAIDLIAEGYGRVPSPLSVVVLPQMGGEIARRPADATAFSQRHAAYSVTVLGCWTDPADDLENAAWTAGLGDELARFSAGVYVNELHDEGEDRIRSAYGADSFARLQALKARYDPTNLFRLNQNIPPMAPAER